MPGDRSYCHRCRLVTAWTPMRGGRRLRCTGAACTEVFPCRHECQHLDCAAAREVHSTSYGAIS